MELNKSSTQPLVSIVVPVYNLANYIDSCLLSLREQTYSNIEIIIIDDGSTDDSKSVIGDHLKADSRLIYIYQDNGGAAKARNTGLRQVRGEYIMFVDGDDMLSPTTIQDNIRYFSEIDSLDWVAFSVVRVDKNGNSITNKCIYGDYNIDTFEVVNSDIFIPYFFQHKLSGLCCGHIFRRESISDMCFSEGEYYEDSMFYTDILCNTKKGVLSPYGKYLYVHRPGSSQLQKLDYKHLKSDFKSKTKWIMQYRAKFPQYEEYYTSAISRCYYKYKTEMAKGTDGANDIYKQFKSNYGYGRISILNEIKILIYRIIGYNNVSKIIQLLNWK